MRQAMIYLQKYGISTTLAAKIYQYYGNGIYRVLEENPYQMADHISGVGFRTADEIATENRYSYGFRLPDPQWNILYIASGSECRDMSICLDEELLARRAGQLLGVDLEHIEKYLMDLCYGTQGDSERSGWREASISDRIIIIWK